MRPLLRMQILAVVGEARGGISTTAIAKALDTDYQRVRNGCSGLAAFGYLVRRNDRVRITPAGIRRLAETSPATGPARLAGQR